ncbi:GntR family transcriptional regulator [Labrenzia sp. OB1]|uniref:GntR family transcriptional regulator n=1 Tax=Labrenzia sp. OB1 TaxID=1561204 RepID=UPI000837C090|nr:GntR family transcriptional regulator [Labrenzia sp. OB1]
MYDRNSPFTSRQSVLEPKQKTEFAEERLSQAILWCELTPGSTATEVELAERFGLGRAATRAALAKLSAFGLMQSIPRLGWRVLPMSGALIGQVISARRLAEPALAEAVLTAGALGQAANLANMISIIGDQCDEGSLSTRRGYERDLLDLACQGVNPIVANFLASLWDQSDRIVRFLEIGGAKPMGSIDAEALVDALVAGERALAETVLMEHLDRFQSFASAGLLNDGSELVLDGGNSKRQAASGKKQEETKKPADGPIRVSSRDGSSSRGT